MRVRPLNMKRIIVSLIATFLGLIIGYTGYTYRANHLRLRLELQQTQQQKQELDKKINEQVQQTEQLKKQNDDLQIQLQSKKQQQAVLASAVTRVEAPRAVFTGNVEQWRSLVSQYNWNVDTVLAIMRCESGGNPNAVGDRSTAYASYGLMQVRALPGRPSPEWLLVPENNIAYAYQLYASSGFRPWTCYFKI